MALSVSTRMQSLKPSGFGIFGDNFTLFDFQLQPMDWYRVRISLMSYRSQKGVNGHVNCAPLSEVNNLSLL